jgi:hypothetical protein
MTQVKVITDLRDEVGTSLTNHSKEKDEDYEDVGGKWIEVIRKSRGKHPKKKFQYQFLFLT